MHTFTDEQRAFQDTARDFFAKECSVEDLRYAWSNKGIPDYERWNAMADLGLLGLGVPASHGGLDVMPTDLVLILEEAGYAALPEPLLETAAVVGPIITAFGTDAQKDEWLPRIAAGEAMATALLMGADAAPAGGRADLVLVAQGGEAHLVPSGQFDSTEVNALDPSIGYARIEAKTNDSTRLEAPREALVQAEFRAAAAAAAFLNGVSRRLLDMSIKYAMERQQFGRTIGSFQAVKHMLAEVASAVETARPSAWHAADEIADGSDGAALASSVAKAAANEAGFDANYVSLQVHGGIGFTWEHDLHLWLKRGKTLEGSYGSSRYHHRILGDALMAAPDLVEFFVPSPADHNSHDPTESM